MHRLIKKIKQVMKVMKGRDTKIHIHTDNNIHEYVHVYIHMEINTLLSNRQSNATITTITSRAKQ